MITIRPYQREDGDTFEGRITHFLDPQREPGQMVVWPEDIRRLIEERDKALKEVERLRRENKKLYLYGVTG